MIRGFLSGVVWGTVVSALGLGAVSQLTPLPAARIAANATAVQRAKPAPVKPLVAPVAEAVAPAVVEIPMNAATAPAAAPVSPVTEALDPPAGSEFAKPLPDTEPVVPAADVAPLPVPNAAAPLAAPETDAATVTDAPSVAPETGLLAPKLLDAPDANADASEVVTANDGANLALAVPGKLAAPGKLALPQADVALLPVQDPAPAAPNGVLLKPLPESLPVPESSAEPSLQLTPEPALVPVTGPETDPAADPAARSSATLEPTPGLGGTVDGVTTGRLPRIGDAPAAPDGEIVPATKANPDGSTAIITDGGADLPPLQKYARKFDNPDEKPLFAIILIDTGGTDIDRAALAALPFAVTFALDPLAANVGQASKIYRDAGQEVIMVATGIPAGATASDLEVTFQAHANVLPEAVAVLDTEFGAFQADRPRATQVVPILKAQGRGLISWDRGLNAADQVARRDGLAAGLVFRKLDGNGENKAAVRRALDRAAFKAAQDGRVIVIGQTQPGTVAALMAWVTDARAASVALAPVSAALRTQ